MKLTKKQLNEIKKFVRKCLLKNDSFHGMFHTEQTVKLSKALAKKEKADINKCMIIAWLHDIAKNKGKKNIDHEDEGSKIAKFFLKSLNFSKQNILEICYGIKQHNKGGKKKTKEAKIIWDADKLQGVGPYGLLRVYGIHINSGENQKGGYKKNIQEQKFFIQRFHTKTARKLAKENFLFMKKFDKRYKNILKANVK